MTQTETYQLVPFQHQEKVTNLDEERDHAAPRPPIVARKFSPSIKVTLASSIPDHTVDQASSSNALAHWHRTCSAIKLRLRDSRHAPLVEQRWLFTNVDWILDQSLVVITKKRQYGPPHIMDFTYSCPASRQRTVVLASSVRRADRTSPAIPHPTTM